MTPRVLHLAPFLWSGAGAVITRLCLAQRRDYRVGLVTSGQSKGEVDWPSYVERIDTAPIPRFTVDLFDRDPGVFWRSVDDLARLVRDWRPDIVHAHAGVPACAAAMVRVQSPRRFSLVAHLYSWATGRPAWMNTMDLQGFAAADRVVCSAEAYRRTLLDAGVPKRRIAYVPWGLDLAAVRAAGRRRTPKPAAPVLGFVGRIEPRKHQLELVEGFARYVRRAGAARLELVGPVADTAYGREIARAVRAHRLHDRVTLAGLVPSVPPRLAQWDLFVSLSDDEGQGLAVLEAMALGVPVLARRVAGIEDYLDDGATGVVLKSGSPSHVAAAIDEAWRTPARMRAMAGRASRMVSRRYDWELTVRRMQEVYAGAAA